MTTARLPAARIATLLIGLGVLNFVVTAFVAMVAAKHWGRMPAVHAHVTLFANDGSKSARFDVATPESLAELGDGDHVETFELDAGSRAEVRVPRGDLERIASTSNTLKVMQLALPLAVSFLFLAAGLRLRKAMRAP